MTPNAPVTVIRYSCVTGQAVWLYTGPTKAAMTKAYYRTVQRERKRQRQYPKVQQRRQANIRRLLDECIAALPLLGDLTREQKQAIRTLRTMADNPPPFSSPLLEHDRERRHQYRLKLRRQRYWHDADFRKSERERIRIAKLKRRERENAERLPENT